MKYKNPKVTTFTKIQNMDYGTCTQYNITIWVLWISVCFFSSKFKNVFQTIESILAYLAIL